MYLNGHTLENVISSSLPTKLSRYTGVGFCYEFAALMMITLKGDHTARLVQGFATALIDGKLERFAHAWTEYTPNGDTKVIDLYTALNAMDKTKYYREREVEVKFISSYESFWETPTAQVLYRCMQSKDVSYIWPILANFRPIDQPFGFHTRYLPNPDKMDLFGKEMPECWVIGKNNERIFIRQELFDLIVAP